MHKYDIKSLLIVFAGLFTVIAAALDWNWFMQHRKAVFWTKLFGHNGARAFYILLGMAITIGGVFLFLGTVH